MKIFSLLAGLLLLPMLSFAQPGTVVRGGGTTTIIGSTSSVAQIITVGDTNWIRILRGFGTNTTILGFLGIAGSHQFTNLAGAGGTPTELTLVHSNSGANTLAVWNKSDSGFSAIAFRATNNFEHGALGFYSQPPNAAAPSVFDWSMYLQTWAPNGVTMPRFVLTHDGNLKNDISGNANFGFYRRFTLETNLQAVFWKGITFVNGTEQERALTISNNTLTISQGGGSSGINFNNEIRAVDENSSLSLRSSAAINTGAANANDIYSFGGTMAQNGGFRVWSQGSRASQTQKFMVSDDGITNMVPWFYGGSSNASPVNTLGQLATGEIVKIANGAGSQTPWLSDINAAGFALTNATGVTTRALYFDTRGTYFTNDNVDGKMYLVMSNSPLDRSINFHGILGGGVPSMYIGTNDLGNGLLVVNGAGYFGKTRASMFSDRGQLFVGTNDAVIGGVLGNSFPWFLIQGNSGTNLLMRMAQGATDRFMMDSNGTTIQTFSLAASTAPAAQGAAFWNDGTNACIVFRNGGGVLTTNKISMAAWP